MQDFVFFEVKQVDFVWPQFIHRISSSSRQVSVLTTCADVCTKKHWCRSVVKNIGGSGGPDAAGVEWGREWGAATPLPSRQ